MIDWEHENLEQVEGSIPGKKNLLVETFESHLNFDSPY